MLCGNCNHETLEGAAFCTHCGTAMSRICSSCGKDNPPTGRFCQFCGMNLTEPAARPSPPPDPQPGRPVGDQYRVQDPYQSRSAPASQSVAATGVLYGGFWVRFVGELIDTAILLIPTLLLYLIVPFVGDAILNAAYFIAFWAVWGATPGKRLLGLRIERPDGAPMGPGRCVARYFASFLSLLLLGIGYIMIGLREDKRGLHDLICDTVVVQREPVSLSEMVNEFWSRVRGVAR